MQTQAVETERRMIRDAEKETDMENRLSDGEKVFIISGAEADYRVDGRRCEDFRNIMVESGVIDTTDGSARVRFATTDLLVGVKCELQSVENSAAVQDRIRFSVDCSANATPQFEGKGGNEFADEIACALRTAYSNDYVVPDFEKLAVSPSHVWILHVDIVILQYGGSIIEAASIGAIAALTDTNICEVETKPADENRVTVEMSEMGKVWNLDTTRFPVIVSVNKLGKANVVDCSLNEETCIRSAVCFGFSFSNKMKPQNLYQVVQFDELSRLM
ncbi:hypothetical protein WR25_17268 [Diploscapter pachys]|uniref:Ribosomal RNA-processing protein 42 n=1 Tax=Diploscapter pachys TaxID=2018661 RepID=A0A2A2L048_9BILA|nr:hypothetical protein WR25_17268 [Diploscapter pachys]